MPDPARADRLTRSELAPFFPGLAGPGINAAMGLSPGFGAALRELAEQLLVEGLPGSSLSRGGAEALAAAVSGANSCWFCADSHAAVAERVGDAAPDPALVEVALAVARLADASVIAAAVDAARRAGCTDPTISHAVAIASAFAMYNRLVEGLGAATPADAGVHAEVAVRLAGGGYRR